MSAALRVPLLLVDEGADGDLLTLTGLHIVPGSLWERVAGLTSP
jgi:hypothetical protein